MTSKTTNRRFSQVSDVLSAILTKRNLRSKIEDCKVIEIWPDVVGEPIAVKTKAVGLRKGALKVVVSDHGWLQQLQFLKEEIRTRLNKSLGRTVVREFYFYVGEVDTPQKPEPELSEQMKWAALSGKDKRLIDKAADLINDEEIKKAVKKVMIKERKRKMIAGKI